MRDAPSRRLTRVFLYISYAYYPRHKRHVTRGNTVPTPEIKSDEKFNTFIQRPLYNYNFTVIIVIIVTGPTLARAVGVTIDFVCVTFVTGK